MQQSPGRHGTGSEIAGLKGRYGALRQAAALPGADPGTLLEAALAELDAAVAALAPAATTQCAAAARKGETRQFRCGLLTAAGAVEHVLAVHPVSTQGNAAHLVVAVTSAAPAPAGRRGKPRAGQRAEPAAEVVQAM